MNRYDRRHPQEIHVPLVGQTASPPVIPQRVLLKEPKLYDGVLVQDAPFEGWAVTSMGLPTGFLHVMVDMGDRRVRLGIYQGDVDFIYQVVE